MNLIGCMRLSDVNPGRTIPGSMAKEKCRTCGEIVLMAPSSQELMASGGAVPMCLKCVDKDPDTEVLLMMTQAQRSELEAFERAEAGREAERN